MRSRISDKRIIARDTQANMTKGNAADRRNDIHRLRKEGATFTQIARSHRISAERARQLFAEAEYAEKTLPTLPLLFRKLSTRTRNHLIKYFGGDEILYHPERLALIGGNHVHKIKNVGRITLREIGAILYQAGYIDCVQSWMEQPPRERKET